MLGLSSRRSFSPKTKRAWLKRCSHQLNHVPGRQTELSANGIEAGTIFPGHLNDAVKLLSGQVVALHFV